MKWKISQKIFLAVLLQPNQVHIIVITLMQFFLEAAIISRSLTNITHTKLSAVADERPTAIMNFAAPNRQMKHYHQGVKFVRSIVRGIVRHSARVLSMNVLGNRHKCSFLCCSIWFLAWGIRVHQSVLGTCISPLLRSFTH